MPIQRKLKMLVEPPAAATGDIAFNLIVFFLVCVSVTPESGREQNIPRAESKSEKTKQSQNVEVALTRTTVSVNGNPVRLAEFPAALAALLQGKTRPEDKVVVVKSAKDVTYATWIQVTGWIEQAGGTVTLQVEEERTVAAP